jgi:hypothetical protein
MKQTFYGILAVMLLCAALNPQGFGGWVGKIAVGYYDVAPAELCPAPGDAEGLTTP